MLRYTVAMRRTLRYLRIAVTALSLTACVLLIALWVRSYWRYDWFGGLSATPRNNEFLPANACLIESASGVLVVIYAGNLREWLSSPGQMIGSSPAMSSLRVTGDEGESAWDGFRAKIYPNGIFRGSVPHWFFAFVLGSAGAVPWIRRFSLRTLLIATALVEVVLGLVIT